MNSSLRKLTRRELNKTTALLSRITPIPFMEEVVFKTFWKAGLMPMVTLEFLIFETNPFAETAQTLPPILLSYREDEYYKAWHVPGGYLGAKETVAQATKRILHRELGSAPKTVQPLFVLNHPKGSREHHVSLFIATPLSKSPRLEKGSLEYFSPSRLPASLISYYRKVFPVVKKILAFSRTLPAKQQKEFFKMLSVCEISGK